MPITLPLIAPERLDPTVRTQLERWKAELETFANGFDSPNSRNRLQEGIDEPTGIRLKGTTTLEGILVTPPLRVTLNTDIDELDPENRSIIRLFPTGATRTVHGMKAARDGRRIIIFNSGDEALVLKHRSTTASLGRRFHLSTGADVTIAANASVGVDVYFDALAGEWVQIGGSDPGATILDLDTDEVAVTNTTSETSVYSFAVPANRLEAGKGLRARLEGYFFKSAGSASNFSLKVTFGGTTLASGVIQSSIGAGSVDKGLISEVTIAVVSASDQRAVTRVLFGTGATEAAWTSWATDNNAEKNDLSLDLTTALTIDFLVTHAVADPGQSFKKHLGLVQVLRM